MPAYPGGLFGGTLTPTVPTGGPSTVLDATAKMPIGSTFLWNGGVFRYVKYSKGTGSVATVVGGPAWPTVITPAATATAQPVFTVTPDQTDSIMGNTPCGVFLAIIATTSDTYFVCIQVGGKALCIVPAAIEEDTIVGSTTDGQFGRIAAGSNITRTQVGIRLEGASSSGLSPVWLMNMDY